MPQNQPENTQRATHNRNNPKIQHTVCLLQLVLISEKVLAASRNTAVSVGKTNVQIVWVRNVYQQN
jgi:hypothetical protein